MEPLDQPKLHATDTDVVHVKFTLDLPRDKWLSRLSLSHPSLAFSIFSMLPLDENLGNTLVKVQGSRIDHFLEEFTNLHAPSFSFTVLYKGDENILLDVKTSEPSILRALQHHCAPILYPILVSEGKAIIRLLAPRKDIDSFLTDLESMEIRSSINQIGPYMPSKILSSRQEEILKHLVDNGYFDIPRERSISSLAIDLGISPSTLSQNIRRIFRNLSSMYFAE